MSRGGGGGEHLVSGGMQVRGGGGGRGAWELRFRSLPLSSGFNGRVRSGDRGEGSKGMPACAALPAGMMQDTCMGFVEQWGEQGSGRGGQHVGWGGM